MVQNAVPAMTVGTVSPVPAANYKIIKTTDPISIYKVYYFRMLKYWSNPEASEPSQHLLYSRLQ